MSNQGHTLLLLLLLRNQPRSNQLTPPIYKIVSTNICGEHRFASAVAHRLQQLGALTQGDRRAASASEAMAAFNLQTR